MSIAMKNRKMLPNPMANQMAKRLPKRWANRIGFTIVETMIVIVLVGLLTAMVGPPMYGYLQAHRLQSGTDRLVADISYARAQATSRSRVLRISTTVNSYTITDPSDGAVLRQQNLDQGIVLAVAQQADFYPWGMADASVFNISNMTGANQISLLPTGIVEVQ